MKPSPRIEPLPPQHSPELEETFDRFRQALGFIPNSMLILQRKPKLVKARRSSPPQCGSPTARSTARSSA